tara:strand:- start:946 stop:1125 length:180 start_codon:yes stop_codon:yes gene_type:complete
MRKPLASHRVMMVSAITLFRFFSRLLGYLALQENPQDGAGFDLWVLVVDFLSVMAQLDT